MKLPENLKRFFDVLGAVVASGAVTAFLLWLVSDVMGATSTAVGYFLTGVFVVGAAIFYQVVKRLTQRTPGMVFVILAAVVGLLGFVYFNTESLGVEDPFVPILLIAAAVALGYFFTPAGNTRH